MKNILEHELFIFDLDGVIYESHKPIINAVESVNRLVNMNKKIAFLTNNSSQEIVHYEKKISQLGIKLSRGSVFSSAGIAAQELRKIHSKDSKAFIIGENGLILSMKESGFNVINENYLDNNFHEILENPEITVDFIISGLDRTITYNKLAAASILIRRGAKFYVTNNDPSLPSAYGLLPGSGSIASMIETATDKKPELIFGKPMPNGINEILLFFNESRENAIIIGDRIDTDIMCGKNANIATAVVLTGATQRNELNRLNKKEHPDYILDTLLDIFN